MPDLQKVPLEQLLAELRLRGFQELPRVDLREFSIQQLALAVRSLSAKAVMSPCSVHGNYDFTSYSVVADLEVKRDMESVALVTYVNDPGEVGPLYRLTHKFRDVYPLCHDAPFQDARVVTDAMSGVLVGPRLLATAGHVLPPLGLRYARIVFGYTEAMLDGDALSVPEERVYRVVREVKRGDGLDWVLVELDRYVEDVTIRPIFHEAKIRTGRPIHLIGHPRGMPLQYAGSAVVKDSGDKGTFSSNVDAFKGCSGAPIFDAETHQLAGIYYSGRPDWLERGMCNEYSADETDDGEMSVHITELAPYIL